LVSESKLCRVLDPFAHAIEDERELDAIYPPPGDRALRKDGGHLDAVCARPIAVS